MEGDESYQVSFRDFDHLFYEINKNPVNQEDKEMISVLYSYPDTIPWSVSHRPLFIPLYALPLRSSPGTLPTPAFGRQDRQVGEVFLFINHLGPACDGARGRPSGQNFRAWKRALLALRMR